MKKSYSAIRMALLMVLVWTIAASANLGALAAAKASVYADTMKVYSRESASSQYQLGALSEGTSFSVLSISGNWAKIEYKGNQGYARVADMRAAKGTAMYTNAAVSVYKSAGSSSSIGKLAVNTRVYMVGWSGNYYLVDNGNGATGYIAKKYLSNNVTSQGAYTNCATTLYKTASGSGTIMSLAINTRVNVTDSSGSYCMVKNDAGTVTGYVKKSCLSASKTTVKKVTAYTNCECPVYKKASSSSSKLCTAGINTKVYVVGESGSYYQITNTAETATGYVAKGKLSAGKTTVKAEETPNVKRGTYSSSTSSTTMPSSLKSKQSTASSSLSNSAKLEYAIYYAQSRLGCYYSEHPNNTSTYDCLTLLYYGFKAVGVKIPSTAYKCGYSGSYAYIKSISDLKRGDIVCFDTITDNDLSDHVGIYLGSGYMLHASSGAGMVVVSTMKSGYYKEHFTCGRRILG